METFANDRFSIKLCWRYHQIYNFKENLESPRNRNHKRVERNSPSVYFHEENLISKTEFHILIEFLLANSLVVLCRFHSCSTLPVFPFKPLSLINILNMRTEPLRRNPKKIFRQVKTVPLRVLSQSKVCTHDLNKKWINSWIIFGVVKFLLRYLCNVFWCLMRHNEELQILVRELATAKEYLKWFFIINIIADHLSAFTWIISNERGKQTICCKFSLRRSFIGWKISVSFPIQAPENLCRKQFLRSIIAIK